MVALGLLVVVLGPRPAWACHNAITWSLDLVAMRIRAGEGHLVAGRTTDALRAVRPASGLLRHGTVGELELVDRDRRSRRAADLRARIDRLVALVILRRDGAVDRSRVRTVGQVEPAERAANLVWALVTLRAGADPAAAPDARAHWAEALAALGSVEEPRRILRALADADLMPDAWSYRLLAGLEDRGGEHARRDVALVRCRERAGDGQRFVCPRLVAVPM